MKTVKDIMTTELLSAQVDWPINRLSQFFQSNHISGAPVKNNDGHIVGVVSITDLARHNSSEASVISNEQPHEYFLSGGLQSNLAIEEFSSFQLDDNSSMSVRDIMTPIVFDIEENASLQQAAEVMITGHIHRLFVSRNKVIIGVISTMDMLQVIRDLPYPDSE